MNAADTSGTLPMSSLALPQVPLVQVAPPLECLLAPTCCNVAHRPLSSGPGRGPRSLARRLVSPAEARCSPLEPPGLGQQLAFDALVCVKIQDNMDKLFGAGGREKH